MIKNLQRRFIKIATLSVVSVLAVIVLAINVIHCTNLVSRMDYTLQEILAKDSIFTDIGHGSNKVPSPGKDIEWPYRARYFLVVIDENENVLSTDTDHIVSITDKGAVELAQKTIKSGKSTGFADMFRYRYLVKTENGVTTALFLSCESEIDQAFTVLDITGAVAIVGAMVIFALVVQLSYRAMLPVVEAESKQKQFIADAGHEIKTPLAIISANADVLALEVGDNEWLDGIKNQTKRLSKLVARLLELSTMEQSEQQMMFDDFDISAALLDVAEDFKVLAITKNKELAADVQQDLIYKGDEAALRQMFGLLIENSVKYASPASTVYVSLQMQGGKTVFKVQNKIDEPIPKRQLVKLFHRFYRTDTSRNSENGGYGIGLSIAQSIAQAHGGKISATCPTADQIEFKTVL